MNPYQESMNIRSDGDKELLTKNNCVTFKKVLSPSVLSMLNPKDRMSISQTSNVNFSTSYQLSPTQLSLSEGAQDSQNVNKFPPSCGFDRPVQHNYLKTPFGFYTLNQAYNPSIGHHLNLGQLSNLKK
jgi:hypothetical protein